MSVSVTSYGSPANVGARCQITDTEVWLNLSIFWQSCELCEMF